MFCWSNAGFPQLLFASDEGFRDSKVYACNSQLFQRVC